MSTPQPTEDFGGEPKRRSPWLIVGGLIGLGIIAALAWGAIARGQTEPTPEPTLVPTAVPVASDAVCERVDASGTIVVGTAPDYPPFEYYNNQFRLDGFDIALMSAIGQELGVSVQFKDYAFDGLFGALQLGEIDAAIAAITVTDEREAQVDFSDAYYAGVGAAVAQAGEAPTSIAAPADFAGWRVGVERGTVYQSWAEANLVAPGIVPEQELFAYQTADDAIGDLLQSRLDVVLLDDAVATGYTGSGALAIVGEGGVIQEYAVAAPQDAACMQARINQALAALTAEGVINELAQAFIGAVSVPIPTPTPGAPAPTPTPAPPAACIDSSQYVMDLTYDDHGGTAPPTVQPGQSFTKGWRIRNSGTCPWGPDYRLTYVGGNNKAAQMDGQPVNVVGQVAPGQTYDFYVDLNAPSGVYGVMQARWQMQNPARVFFGQTVWVMVDVVPPTPGPTAPPQATATTPPQATATGQATQPPQPTATLPPPPTEMPNPLEGPTFAFYAINGQPTIPGTVLSVAFESGGQLSGSDGCNTFQGTYIVQPAGLSQGAITITLGPSTTLACAQDVTTQAQAFVTALGQATAYAYPPEGLLLTLLDQTGTDILNGELQ
jgi:polar amino acid transport system substrate-binding protein